MSKIDVCESCIETALEEGAGPDIAEVVCREMGLEMADHLCEAREGDAPDCACGCRVVGSHLYAGV